MAENSPINVNDIIQMLSNNQVDMFAKRDNVQEAFDYAMEVSNDKVVKSHIAVAIMVYHNTLLEQLKEVINASYPSGTPKH